VTGLLIDKARLKAVPHATLSLEAKLGYVKNSPNVPE
jgi:RNA polymerase-binding transcription factor DksA